MIVANMKEKISLDHAKRILKKIQGNFCIYSGDTNKGKHFLVKDIDFGDLGNLSFFVSKDGKYLQIEDMAKNYVVANLR